MKWVIVGAGALGSILAAHLAAAGEDVTLLARGARARLLQENGVTLTGLKDMNVKVSVADHPDQVGDCDVLVLTVKTYDMQAALQSLAHVNTTNAISVQNGLVKEEQLAAAFGVEAVLGAVADFSGQVQPDGVVRFTRNEGLHIGEMGGPASERVRSIASAIHAAGLNGSAAEDILSVEWSKMVGWMPLTAVAVLTRLVTPGFLTDPDCAGVMYTMAHEAAQITQRLGIEINDLVAVAPARTMLEMTPEAWIGKAREIGQGMRAAGIGQHRMSALQDIEAGKRLEVEETFGYALLKAKELGLALPTLEASYRLLSGISRARE